MPTFTAPVHEANDCHLPAGTPEGGQFCSKTAGWPSGGDWPEPQRRAEKFQAFEQAFMVRTGAYVNPINGRELIFNNTVGLEIGATAQGIRLSSIRSFAPGQRSGEASKALKALTALADEMQVPLTGTVHRFKVGQGKTLTKKQLVAWYKRHGFTVNGDSIRREPR